MLTGTTGKARPLLVGQWCKASQLPPDWQQQQQQQHEQQAVQMSRKDSQQLPHARELKQPMQESPLKRQEQQQQYGYTAVPQGPAGQQVYFGSPQAAKDVAAAGQDTTAPGATYDDSFPERGTGRQQQQLQHWQLEQQSNVNKGRSTWACLACTYSSNKAIMLRCEICDTLKGDSSAPPASWLRTKSSEASDSSSVKAGSQSRQQGNRSQTGGSKQTRLDSVVQTRAVKARRR